MGCDRESAGDLTQEIFIKVYRNLSRFRGSSSVSTWIFSVATNHCLDYFRKTNSFLRALKSLEIFQKRSQTFSTIEEDVVEHHTGLEILKRLPPKQRALLILKQYMGFSYKELAEIMGTSVSVVGVLLSRAREDVLKIAEKEGIEL
jgi:RNA polymerase sigma-70 factor (ECF subfamily)